MPDQTYLFIDGEYLRRRHREEMQRFFGVDGQLDLPSVMEDSGAIRSYFYDAIDYTHRPAETEKEWEDRILALENSFSYVRSLCGFHVRPGSVTRGKKREQKEVDVLLAVDMLTQGFRGSMSKAILIAGDVDFRPAIEELVRHGVFVEVWYHGNSFAQELPGAADFGRQLRFKQLYSWNTEAFKKAHRIPREQLHAGSPYGELVKVGSVGGCSAELHRDQIANGPDDLSLWITIASGDTLCIRDHDEKLIERYVATQYSAIEWQYRAEEITITENKSRL